jgi:trehalose 6-phosphate phosphatase
MQHLLAPAGRAALEALMHARPLLAFDFDGTLAPIVATPGEARIGEAVALRLRRLAARLPVAIVTGRAAADVRGRLGFEPQFVVGNHGAEDGLDREAAEARARALDALRSRLAREAAAIRGACVTVEDKGQSIALHYRLAPDRAAALALIHRLLAGAAPALKVFGGKMVENVVAADAADKAQAVIALVARCGADRAFFAGDDVNDEPVFAAAPSNWLTLRVGRDDPRSRARFFLDSPAEMALALQAMIDELDARHAG